MRAALRPSLIRSWLILVAVSVISFTTAEFLDQRLIAVSAILAIAAAKILIIFSSFMEIGHAPKGIRIFLFVWTIGCAAMIFGLWWYASL